MTKTELVAAMAVKSQVSKAVAEKALNGLISSVTEVLKKGGKVALVGFGTFEVVKRAARKGRNPRTGQEIKIKASKAPKFRPGKGLKKAVS
jgi:DNA-binding protein HU-beta